MEDLELKIIKLEQKNKLLQEITLTGVWEWNFTTNETFWSDQMYKLFEVKKGEFHPRLSSCLKVLHPDDSGLMQDAFNCLGSPIKNNFYDFRIITPKGVIKYLRNIVVESSNDKLICFLTKDITELVVAEKELKKNELDIYNYSKVIASFSKTEESKKMDDIIFLENPNPVFRINYDLDILYSNNATKLILSDSLALGVITNEKLILEINKVILRGDIHSRIKVRFTDTTYFFYISNFKELKCINIYGVDNTSLINTQERYLKLSLDLESVIEKRTEELNLTVEILNKEAERRIFYEEKIKNSLVEKETLLNEITHRVKNNLQVISSLLSLQKETINNEETFQMLSDTESRIKSMSLIHETLYKSSNFSQINIKDYITSLISYIRTAFDTTKIEIIEDVENLNLTIETATNIGMVIMELMTNSVKHAFKKDTKGEIKLVLNQAKDENYLLLLSDNGKGYTSSIDLMSKKSLGMQLIVGITKQLKGSIEKKDVKGTAYKIIFKDTKKHKHE
jgi:two-component sensor histidine kinase